MERSEVTLTRTDIPGWGVDADPRNDPTYPMRDRSKDDAPGRHWPKPDMQPQNVELLRSIEHTERPAVFGASSPPSGLSGAIRREAFTYSESRWTHWLLLLLADRINVVEGLAEDLASGKVPNLIEELGLPAQWKYNRKAFLKRSATAAVITIGALSVFHLVRGPRRRRRRLERR